MRVSYIYVLSNNSMPGLLKIGRTDRSPIDRAKELSTTGVPTPFVLEYFLPVEDSVLAESLIHKHLEEIGCRATQNREFFELTTNNAKKIIEQVLGLEIGANEGVASRSDLLNELEQLNVPWSASLTHEEAWHLSERLAELAQRGLPEAMQTGARVFRMCCKWPAKYREFSQKYFSMALKECQQEPLYGMGRRLRAELGKNIANHLEILSDNNWIAEDDFSYVSSFLVSGDQFIYEGYITEVEKTSFSEEIKQRALNL